ncbi:hypothetical protein EW026_g8147 [Hermanssonia centrifuga]|uniref:DUF6535 domain-containing protein n=1 Tax=Hermanssonia centrifuga TaxID=98765 RepID=A0A4S4K5B7_9APHY|nr:hypothetical protein EW026_g8147 [Hermanssonia centrifuga]
MDEQPTSEGNIRYVVSERSGGGYVVSEMSTGWTEMTRTVKEVDEGKVKDCKEDIDTLLVFAGLFSAVMTAFLIESYQLLLPSDTTTIIALLTQMTLQSQSYIIGSGFVNATISIPANPTTTFEPTLSAIRINALWFTSLIFSLITASFGILVKQWLREYLGVDYTSPRARLRARQFRYPGLAKWKVFEIAALLPLLLQLSLGLFFVGLWWGFLLVTVTIAPVLSPRCPYKTTLLKVPLKFLRRLLRRSSLFRTLYWKLRNTTTREESPIDPTTAAEEQLALKKEKERLLLLEEDEAVTNESSDLEMLVAVDTILLDDDLLRTTIWDSLRQTQPDPADVVKFVLQVIDNRLQQKIDSSSLGDLRQLTKTAWNAVVDIIADTLIRNFAIGPSTSAPKWMEDALMILLSLSDFALTKNGNRALLQWMSVEAYEDASRIIASHALDYNSFVYAFRRLCTLYALFPSQDLRKIILYIACDYLASGYPDMPFSDVVLTWPELPTDMIHAVVPMALDIVREASISASREWAEITLDAWRTVMLVPVPPNARKDFGALLEVLARERWLFVAMGCIVNLDVDHAVEPAAVHNFVQAYTDIGFEGRREILSQQIVILDRYVAGILNDTDKWNPMSPVRLCRLYLRTLDATQKTSTSESDVELRSNWRELWKRMASAIGYLKSMEHYDVPEHRQLAEECLTWLQDLEDETPPSRHGGDAFGRREEDPNADYRDWLQDFRAEESMFPDDLIRALSSFVPHEVTLTFNRVRRIHDPETRMQAFASGMPEASQSSNYAQVSEFIGQPTTSSNHSVTLEVIPRWKILIEMHSTSPSDIIKFIRDTIATCLTEDNICSSSWSILDLRHLTRRSWQDIIDIIADTVIGGFDPGLELSSWTEDALVILLSFSDFSLTTLGNRALSLWMSPEARMHTIRIIASHTPDYESFTHVLRRLRTVFTSYIPDNVVLCLTDVVRSQTASEDPTIELWDIIRKRRELHEDTTHVVLLILSDILNNRLLNPQGQAFTLDGVNALRNLLSSPVPVCARQDVSTTLSKLLQQGKTTYFSTSCITALYLEDRAFEESAFHNVQFAYIDSDLSQRRTILQNQRNVLEAYINGVFDNPAFRPMSPVRLCVLYLRIIDVERTNDALGVKLQTEWQEIWNGTAKAISHLRSKEYDVEEHRRLAEESLVWLDELDDGHPPKLDAIGDEVGMESKIDYVKWLKDFKIGESMFPDDLFDALSKFVLDDTAMKSKRVRRSRELRTLRGR